MKIRIEIDEDLTEDELVIHCRQLTNEIAALQQTLSQRTRAPSSLTLHRQDTEYFLSFRDILFFETEEKIVRAHTRAEIFDTPYKLYELEELLPGYFMRISKSAIVNTNHIYSITRNITSSSVVAFTNSHKEVFVSRNYYKALLERLAEKRRT